MRLLFFILFLNLSQLVQALELKGDPALLAQAWYFNKIKIPEAWTLAINHRQIKVAVIDMDFDLQQADLKDSFLRSSAKDFSGNNFAKLSPDAGYAQHGTLVSGLIGANALNSYGSSGILRKPQLIALNIAPVGEPIDIEQVIRFAVDQGAQVINGSFGYYTISDKELVKLRRALRYAQEKDVVLVFSAGNNTWNNDKTAFYPANFTTEFDNVISVGASDQQDQRFKASSYGQKSVDVFAPGVDIIVPVGGERYILTSGTSEAAPITTGVVALMRELNPALSAAQIKKILIQSVDPIESLKNISVSGGRINAEKALRNCKSK